MEATKRPWTAHILDCPKDKIGQYVQQCVDNSGGDEFHFISAPHEDGGDADIAHVGNGPRGKDNAALIVRAVNTFDQAREALKRAQRALLLCEKCIPEKHYMNHGCYTQEHARMSIQEIGDVLTAMEATP